MNQNIWSLIGFAAVALIVVGGLAFLSQHYTLDNIKSKTVGDGQYGTARWGNQKDIAPFINGDFAQNILLTDTERLTLGQIADPEKRNVNLNVLVLGGSGSGKTRYHIKPNLLQMNASYVPRASSQSCKGSSTKTLRPEKILLPVGGRQTNICPAMSERS